MIEKTLRTIIIDPKHELKLIAQGIIIGIFAGLMVCFYRYLLTTSESVLYTVLDIINGNVYLILLWLFILATFGLITGFLIRLEPMSSGSGIPQIDGEVKGYLNVSWWKVLISKTIGGTLATLSGLSLGREGPSIQIGGMAAKAISKIFKASKTDEHRFIISGSAAGLSATFNAPLAGVIFSLEEINHSFDRTLIFVGLIAVIVADFISKMIFGQSTIFNFQSPNIPLNYYWLLVVLGLIIGFLGYIYNLGMIVAVDFWDYFVKIPVELKMVIVFLITGIVGLFIPQILAGGHSMTNALEVAMPPLTVLIILLIAKYLLSVLCFSSGTPGGIFFPLLVLGAYVGAAFGSFVVPIFGLYHMIIYKFIIISMAGFFAATVRAPITGIVLISEMTGSTHSLIAMIIVSIIAYSVPTILKNKPIYSSLLERILNKSIGKAMKDPSKHILSEYVVPLDCFYIGKKIKDIPFPDSCIVVSITREGDYLLANDEIRIKYADQLFVLLDLDNYSSENKEIEYLIYKKKI